MVGRKRKGGAILGLPIPTIFCAHRAKPIGAFGLVWVVFTIAYHPVNLGLPLSCEAFTNHYLRGDGTHN